MTQERKHRGLVRRLLVAVALAVLLVTLGVGRQLAGRDGGDDAADAADRSPAASVEPTTTTAAPTTTTMLPTTTIPSLAQPAPVVLPPPPGGSVRQGDRAAEIMGYEARLFQLRFDPGPVDGVFDEKTRYAAETFDKLMGAERDGVIDAAFVEALSTFEYPVPHVPQGEPHRVEIDLDRQVLVVYRGWQVALVTTTSTGTGKRFCGGDDGCQYAVTPTGRYQFTRHVDGWRKSKLGRLYNPWYFNGGIAVHGFPSVPVKPASHGCARIPMHIAEYFGTLVMRDMPVYVYGMEAPRGGYPADHPNGAPVRRAAAPAPPPPPPPPPTGPPAPPPPPETATTTTTTTVPPTTTTTAPPTTTTTASTTTTAAPPPETTTTPP